MTEDIGARDPALVNDAPTGHRPSGFDPAREEYRFSISQGRERHDWCVIGELGAVNVWAEPSSPGYGERWIGGVECHQAKPPEHASYCGHHERCWLLDAECWHDGSSLQFSEQIEPYLPAPTGKQMDDQDGFRPMLTARNRFRAWLTEPAQEAIAMEARQGGDACGSVHDSAAIAQGGIA